MWDYLKTGMLPGQSSGSSSSTRSRSTQNRNILTAPEVSAQYRPMEGMLQRIMMQRLNSPSALPAGFEQGGVLQTNRTFAPIEKAAQNRLAASGTFDSGAQAAMQAYLGGQRGAEISDFRRNIPLQERAMRNEDMGLAQALISNFGLGRRETGTITEDSESQSSGSSSSGPRFDPGFMQQRKQSGGGRNAFGSIMDMVGFLGGAGMFGGGGARRGGGAGGGAPVAFDMFRTTPFFG
jgi:hypothetical protein